MKAAPEREPKGGRSDWGGFVLGMVGMFIVMALWVVVVEMDKAPDAKVEFIDRPQTVQPQTLERQDAWADRPTSDYR